MDTVQEDTGRHHLYRAKEDYAAAVHTSLLIWFQWRQNAADGLPAGRHRECPVCQGRLGGTPLCPSCEQDGE